MWFIVDSQFQASHDEHSSRQQGLVERLLFLVHAGSRDDAALKAATFAKGKEHSYTNAASQRVHWTFLRVTDIMEMIDQRFEDGAEIISWFSRCSGGVDEDDRVTL